MSSCRIGTLVVHGAEPFVVGVAAARVCTIIRPVRDVTSLVLLKWCFADSLCQTVPVDNALCRSVH